MYTELLVYLSLIWHLMGILMQGKLTWPAQFLQRY